MAIYTKICDYCKKTFQSDRKHPKYCSKECFTNGFSEKRIQFGEEEIEIIKKMRENGHTMEEVAKEIGCCKNTVVNIIKKFSLQLTKEGKSNLMEHRWLKKREADDGQMECIKCHIKKPFDDFYKCERNAFGIKTTCKDCTGKEQSEKKQTIRLSLELINFASQKLNLTVEELKALYFAEKGLTENDV